MTSRLVFGAGYLGLRVAEKWITQGDQVHVVTRSKTKAELFHKRGFVPIVFDIAEDWTLFTVPEVQTVLFAVGYDRTAVASIEQVYVEGIRQAIGKIPAGARWIYISTTGVYGGGSRRPAKEGPATAFPQAEDDPHPWTNEQADCLPERPGAKASLEAEELLLGSCHRERSTILRAAGIYGPGRIPNLAALKGGKPIAADPDSCLNLIHVDDLAEITTQVADRQMDCSIYNVSDGCPVQRRDYYGYLVEHCQLEPVPFLANEPPTSADERRMQRGSKRIESSRIRTELSYQPRFPTYREGIDDFLSIDQDAE